MIITDARSIDYVATSQNVIKVRIVFYVLDFVIVITYTRCDALITG